MLLTQISRGPKGGLQESVLFHVDRHFVIGVNGKCTIDGALLHLQWWKQSVHSKIAG